MKVSKFALMLVIFFNVKGAFAKDPALANLKRTLTNMTKTLARDSVGATCVTVPGVCASAAGIAAGGVTALFGAGSISGCSNNVCNGPATLSFQNARSTPIKGHLVDFSYDAPLNPDCQAKKLSWEEINNEWFRNIDNCDYIYRRDKITCQWEKDVQSCLKGIKEYYDACYSYAADVNAQLKKDASADCHDDSLRPHIGADFQNLAPGDSITLTIESRPIDEYGHTFRIIYSNLDGSNPKFFDVIDGNGCTQEGVPSTKSVKLP